MLHPKTASLEPALALLRKEDPSNRLRYWPVDFVIGGGWGKWPWYRLMHTKLHAWSLPCARVALLDYDVIAIRDPSPIFDGSGGGPPLRKSQCASKYSVKCGGEKYACVNGGFADSSRWVR